MDACKQTHEALCVYGKLKRMKTAGGEKTQAFVSQLSAALALLSIEEQHVVQSLYIREMTQEEAAEALDCDVSTIARRKRRVIDSLALHLYPDEYLQEKGL